MHQARVRFSVVMVMFLFHSVITILSLMEFSFVELFTRALADSAGRQVFNDLGMSLLLISGWMLLDGKKRGATAWPFVVACLPLGSFAPMAYLLLREWRGMHSGEVAPA